MSAELQQLTNDIKNLSDKVGKLDGKLTERMSSMHQQNQADRGKDREAFREALQSQQAAFGAAMAEQRNLFQQAINTQYAETTRIDKTVSEGNLLLRLCVGDGSPGEGRVGILEETVEMLKKYMWQATAVVSFLLLVADKLGPALLKR